MRLTKAEFCSCSITEVWPSEAIFFFFWEVWFWRRGGGGCLFICFFKNQRNPMRTACPQPGSPRSRTLSGGKPQLCGRGGCLDGPAPAPVTARTILASRVSRFCHPNLQHGRARCPSSSSSCCCSLESARGANVGRERRPPDGTSWGQKGAGWGKENSLSSFRCKTYEGGAGCFCFSEPLPQPLPSPKKVSPKGRQCQNPVPRSPRRAPGWVAEPPRTAGVKHEKCCPFCALS